MLSYGLYLYNINIAKNHVVLIFLNKLKNFIMKNTNKTSVATTKCRQNVMQYCN